MRHTILRCDNIGSINERQDTYTRAKGVFHKIWKNAYYDLPWLQGIIQYTLYAFTENQDYFFPPLYGPLNTHILEIALRIAADLIEASTENTIFSLRRPATWDMAARLVQCTVEKVNQISSLNLFISYSHADDELRQRLQTHLKILERQGVLRMWSDRAIEAGTQWEDEILRNLRNADIVLLLISADFLASDFLSRH